MASQVSSIKTPPAARDRADPRGQQLGYVFNDAVDDRLPPRPLASVSRWSATRWLLREQIDAERIDVNAEDIASRGYRVWRISPGVRRRRISAARPGERRLDAHHVAARAVRHADECETLSFTRREPVIRPKDPERRPGALDRSSLRLVGQPGKFSIEGSN